MAKGRNYYIPEQIEQLISQLLEEYRYKMEQLMEENKKRGRPKQRDF